MQMILFCGVSNQPGGQASAGPIGPAHFASAAHMCTPVPTPSVCGGWQAESGGALDGLKSREMAVAPGGPSSSSWTATRACAGAGSSPPRRSWLEEAGSCSSPDLDAIAASPDPASPAGQVSGPSKERTDW